MQNNKMKLNKVKNLIITTCLILYVNIIYGQDLDNNAAHSAATDSNATPLYQKVFNVLSVFVTLFAIFGIYKQIQGIVNPDDTNRNESDSATKGHIKQLAFIVIGLIIWYFGVPFLLKKGFA